MLNTVDQNLNRARNLLERTGVAQIDLLPPAISASWTRCLQAGLDPHRPMPLEQIDAAGLAMRRERADLTRNLALVEMQALYRQIAGSNFLIAFADPDGVLLDTIADPSFRTAAKTASIRPGTTWTEQHCGTNALGTVAQIGRALTVHGGEHFFARHGTLTCTAAPILGPDGQVAGVLDASSHCGSRQPHTQALVGMAATQIENGLFRLHHGRDVIVAFHNRGEYLRTLSAGLLALSPDGTVLGANPQARFLLQGLPALPGRHFDDLFRTRFSALMTTGRSHDPQLLEDRVGSTFIAAAENSGPRVASNIRPEPAPVPADTVPAYPAPGYPAPGYPAPGFIADDPAVMAALRQVAAGARRGLPILIRGETGTGKEQLARYAHQASGRQGAFVAINCAALSATLIEAELFGHVEGAFTGARRGGAPGLVREADGGTLFLDEIGDMPVALQAVLLRLLDDWTVRPVGGGRARQVNVLLVAATNAALDRAVREGRFRADLYYRLEAVGVLLPALRDRRDFVAIARRLLTEIAPACTITGDAMERLSRLSWGGNIRELRNVLVRLTLADADGCIEAGAIDAVMGPPEPDPKSAVGPEGLGLREAVHRRIVAAHRDAAGNLSETARRLGVSRNTIYRAIRATPI